MNRVNGLLRMKLSTVLLTAVLSLSSFAYQISVGTYVSNAGKTVVVPIAIDSVAGLSYAGVSLTYDPQVLVVMKAEEGTLKELLAEDFVAVDTNGVLSVTIFGSATNDVASGSGTIANVTFAVRDGTEGLYSDLALADVSLGEHTGVKDVAVGNPVTTRNGMVRVMGASASVSRLENAQTIVAETKLGTLALKAGDTLQASDWPLKPVVVADAITAEGPVAVSEPVNGWATGTYALLKTPTTGLAFALDGTNAVAGMTVSYSNAVASGMTTYYAILDIPDSFDVASSDAGVDLSAGTRNQICKYVAELKRQAVAALDKSAADYADKTNRYANAKAVKVSGPKGHEALVSTLADIGLSPALAPIDETGTLKLTYEMPKLEITSFDAATGAVRFKVTPGAGNAIVSEIGTGYLHVYGTDDLNAPMTYVSSVGFDLTPYLKSDTKGEGVLNVSLGSHTFLKVKVESAKKNEGDPE